VLPFAYFARSLTKDPTSKELVDVYTWLIEAAKSVWTEATAKGSNEKIALGGTDELPPFSYNLALTDKVMVLCPRMSEGPKIKDINGDLIGPISLNGTILGGTLLVKTDQEWNTVRNDEQKLESILLAIGVPPVAYEKRRKLKPRS
jgi:sulfate adenylyltransferase (ADP) / ATP adenylyltransferase